MGTLGVPACPFECGFEVAVLADFIRRVDMERRALGVLPSCRVVGIMREIVIHKKGIIRPRPFDARLLVCLNFLNQDIPVLAVLEDGEAVLLTGFNEFNIVVMEPSTGRLYKKGMNDTKEWMEKNGNPFITYIRTED